MTTTDRDAIAVYRVAHASVASDSEVDQLRTDLSNLIARTTGVRLAVDLSNTFHVGSRVLGLFVSLSRQVTQDGGRIVLFGVNPAIEKVIAVTHLGSIIPVVTDEPAALALLGHT